MGKPWSIREETYLKANYNRFKNTQISKHLSRTEKSIRTKARKLGLSKYDTVDNYRECLDARHEIDARIKMRDYKVNLTIGDKISIIAGDYDSKRYRSKRNVKGEVIFKNRNYLVVDTGKYKESFLLSDFYTGEAQMSQGGQAVCN